MDNYRWFLRILSLDSMINMCYCKRHSGYLKFTPIIVDANPLSELRLFSKLFLVIEFPYHACLFSLIIPRASTCSRGESFVNTKSPPNPGHYLRKVLSHNQRMPPASSN